MVDPAGSLITYDVLVLQVPENIVLQVTEFKEGSSRCSDNLSEPVRLL